MKKQKKNDPAFARIHEDRIRELQAEILRFAVMKQLMENGRDQYPKSALRCWRRLINLHLFWQFKVDAYWWAIRRKVIEIRRLRGWVIE